MAKALTEAFIKKAVPGKYFDAHRDAPRGFGVKVLDSGRRVFILRYFAEGKDRQLSIGEYPTWSLDAARRQAREFRRATDKGEDILLNRQISKGEPTLKDVAERYFKAHVDKLASGKAVRAQLERDLLRDLGKRKIRNIRRADLIEIVEAKAEETPRAAALLLTHIKGLFAWAVHKEIVENSPAAVIKPSRIAQSLRPRNRARILDDEEIRTLWNKAEACGMHPLTAIALKLILTTGQRPGEVTGMLWSEISAGLWTIPAEKRGKNMTTQTVPLTQTVLDLLQQAKDEVQRLAKRRQWQSDYVFATREASALTVAALDRAVKRYVGKLGNKEVTTWGHWTPHDLRRTCRTGLAACKIPEEIAERVIGHGKKGIVAVYNLHEYDQEKRRALKAWERRLLRIVEGQADEKVVSIGGRNG